MNCLAIHWYSIVIYWSIGIFQLLRSSLVNNRTQSIVCDDLGISDYVIFSDSKGEKQDKKTKEKADLLEGVCSLCGILCESDLYISIYCRPLF